MAYKMYGCTRRTPTSAGQIKKKKQCTNIKRDEITIKNIINDILICIIAF